MCVVCFEAKVTFSWMGAALASNPKVLLQSPVWEILLLL